jgi:hypothetical protein
VTTAAPLDQLPAPPRLGQPQALVAGPAARATVAALSPFGNVQPPTLGHGDLRAALIVAHGAARLFHPFITEIAPALDARLGEVLGSIPDPPPIDRLTANRLLRRLGQALADGHVNVFSSVFFGGPYGFLPVLVEESGGEPLVIRSLGPGIVPGDTIVAIGGEPVADRFARAYALVSAATDQDRFVKATVEAIQDRPVETIVEVRDPAGNHRALDVTPSS